MSRDMDRNTYTVVQLVTRMNIGGAARAVVELAKGLPFVVHNGTEGEYNVIVAAGTPPPEEGELSDPQVPVIRLPLVRHIDPYDDIRSLIALRRLLTGESPYPFSTRHNWVGIDTAYYGNVHRHSSDMSPDDHSTHHSPDNPRYTHTSLISPVDLINTHMAKAGTIGRLAALSMRRQPPSSDLLGEATGNLTNLTVRHIRKRPIMVHTFHGHVLDGYFNRSISKVFTAIERQMARHTDALVAISNEVRDELLSLGIGRPGQWHVIPLGLDLAQYLSIPPPDISTPSSKITAPLSEAKDRLLMELSIPPSATVLAMIARLVPIKDHSTALRALADPNLHDTHLLVVGDGELRKDLEKESRELGIERLVHFLGWRQDIPDILAASDIVILTSTNEGTPATLIEAAAAARPVVATDVGGILSIVVHDETGLLVAPKKPEMLAQAIHRLSSSPSTRRAMGAAARNRAVALYSSASFVSQTAELYRELLSRRTP